MDHIQSLFCRFLNENNDKTTFKIYRWVDVVIGDEAYNKFTQIIELFYKMASMDAESLSHDSCLIREWQWLNVGLHDQIELFYTFVSK